MKPLGKQHIIEFVYCDPEALDNKDLLEDVIRKGTAAANIDIVSMDSHKFDPIGVTVTAIVSDSHIAIHTYPEAQHASIDVFSCSPDSSKHYVLIDALKEILHPETVRYIEINRGNPLDVYKADHITSMSSYGFETKYHVKEHLYTIQTDYQVIDVIDNEEFGKILFLDKDLRITEKDVQQYSDCLVDPLYAENINQELENVLVLGAGNGNLINRLLRYDVKHIELVDNDKELIEVNKKYFNDYCKDFYDDPRVKINISQFNDYLEKASLFDAVIVDLTLHPETMTQEIREEWTKKTYANIKNVLKPGGKISVQCCAEYDKHSIKLFQDNLESNFKDVTFRREFIPSFCENWYFASATK